MRLVVVEPPRVLRYIDAVAGASRARGGRPVAIWDLDGALARSGTLRPFLRRVAGTAAVLRALGSGTSMLQQILGGLLVDDVERIGRAYAGHVVGRRLRPDSLARWSWHRENGHRLVITSAAPGLYLHHIGRQLGADAVICTEMSVVNGRLTGALRGGDCRGAEKARRVLAHLVEQPASRVWAYADGDADRPLLSIADVAVRVERHRRLAG